MTGDGLGRGLSDMWRSVLLFLPKALAFIAVLVIGYLLARLARTLVGKLLHRVGFDRAVDRGAIGRALRGGQISASGLCAKLAFYAVLLFALQLAFGLWGPNAVSDLLTQLIGWLPRAFVAIVIIVVAVAIAGAAHDLIASTLGGLTYGRLLARIAAALIVALGVIAALDQVRIATAVTQPLLIAVLATVAGVIIVGVGGGLVRPMQQRWEVWLDRAGTESVAIREQARAYAEEKARAEAARRAEEERRAEEARAEAARKAEEEARRAEEARQAEEARIAAEQAAEEARQAEEARKAEEARIAAEKAAEEARQAEEARRAEEARIAAERAAEEARAAEARRAEEARQAEQARAAAEAAEQARQAEAARAEEIRRAEEARKAELVRLAEERRSSGATRAEPPAAGAADAERTAEQPVAGDTAGSSAAGSAGPGSSGPGSSAAGSSAAGSSAAGSAGAGSEDTQVIPVQEPPAPRSVTDTAVDLQPVDDRPHMIPGFDNDDSERTQVLPAAGQADDTQILPAEPPAKRPSRRRRRP
jgi:hypothetical protein